MKQVLELIFCSIPLHPSSSHFSKWLKPFVIVRLVKGKDMFEQRNEPGRTRKCKKSKILESEKSKV